MAARNNTKRLAAGLLLLCSGCSFGLDFSAKEPTYYTIVERNQHDDAAGGSQRAALQTGEHFPLDVVVRETRATPFLNGRKIVFGQTTQTRGYYQYAAWVEPLPKRFWGLLAESLRDSQMFDSVSKASLAAKGDIEVVTELIDCYHLIDHPPGVIVLAMEADILETKSGRVLAHQRFEKHVTSETYDADGAVGAISKGIYEVIDDLLKWTATVAPQAERRPPDAAAFSKREVAAR